MPAVNTNRKAFVELQNDPRLMKSLRKEIKARERDKLNEAEKRMRATAASSDQRGLRR